MLRDAEPKAAQWGIKRSAAFAVTALVAVLAVTSMVALATARKGIRGPQTADTSHLLEEIDVTTVCKATTLAAVPVINKKFTALSDPKEVPKKTVTVDGPKIGLLLCKAKTFFDITLEEVAGLSTGEATPACGSADLSLTGKVNAGASMGLVFDTIKLTMKVKAKGTFCKVPKSTSVTVVVTLHKPKMSTYVDVQIQQGLKTKITEAQVSDFNVGFPSFTMTCSGDGCDTDISSPLWAGIIMGFVNDKLSKDLEGVVNDALAAAVPITL